MAAFNAASARTIPGKYIGVALPVTAFVSTGVQHSPANMGYFALYLCSDPNDDVSGKDWFNAIFWNFIPAGIGNLLGGVVFVAAVFFYVHVINDTEGEPLAVPTVNPADEESGEASK